MDWKTIETAPKDGTEILAWHTQDGEYGEPSGAIVVSWFELGKSWYVCGVGGYEMEQERTNLTHWMPLPEAPVT